MVRSVRNTLQSRKYIQKRKRKNIIIALLAFVFVVSFFVSIVYLFRLSFFQIKHIELKGSVTLDESAVVKVVKEDMEGYVFRFIPKINVFFYPKEEIESHLIDDFKEIKDIKITKSGFSSIDINIIERDPVALVCEGFKEEDVGYDHLCMLIDETAYIYSRPFIENSEYNILKFYSNVFTEDLETGQYFLEKEIFMGFLTLVKNLKENDIPTSGVLLVGDHNYELYVRNKDGTNAIVYLDDREPLEKTAERFVAFWSSIFDKKSEGEKTLIFDYIDMRFGNNIFYVTK